MIVFVGCYTEVGHSHGLHAVEVDVATGALTRQMSYATDNALYLARAGEVLYANSSDGLKSFRIDGRSLVPIDAVSLGGAAMCHVAALPGGKRVTWSAYLSGRAGSVEVQNGRFGAVTDHAYSGRGLDPVRQEASHPHCAVPTPDGKGYVVCDLGLDRLVACPSGRVFPTTPSGAGPRHLLFHPNGRLAFVVFELGNLLATYEWSETDGLGRLLDQCSTLDAAGVRPPRDLAAAVRFTPDGRRVVVSNRGEQSLVVFDFEATTGKLAERSRAVLSGDWPRDFVFLTDTLALVAFEKSGDLQSFRYDPERATFSALASLGGFFRPVCLCC